MQKNFSRFFIFFEREELSILVLQLIFKDHYLTA